MLLLRRFDRDGGTRLPFLSAMSMLGAKDNEARSYLEFVDVLRQHGAAPKEDMHALWRRIVFSILISNTDDHLRNHGFLWAGPARVAACHRPMTSIPCPPTSSRAFSTTAIDLEDGTASLKLALEVASYFELGRRRGASPSPRKWGRPWPHGERRQPSSASPRRRSTAWHRLSSMRI